jgi:AraC-like DNA-binding protein
MKTPAGFYKAFKHIFGCSPGKFKLYKNNTKKEGLKMLIENINDTAELDAALNFAKEIYSPALNPKLPMTFDTYIYWVKNSS